MANRSTDRRKSEREFELVGTDAAANTVGDTRAPTVRLGRRRVERVRGELSELDLAIVGVIARSRLATTHQVVRCLPSPPPPRTLRRRLGQLEALRVLARLPRGVGGRQGGSDVGIWALDVVGQRVVAPETAGTLRKPWVPTPPYVDHALGVAEAYARLCEAATAGQLEVLRFESEPSCWRTFDTSAGRIVLKPDALAVLGVGEDEAALFLEVDRATEGPATINRKAGVYQAYFRSGSAQAALGLFPLVVWVVPTSARKRALEALFARHASPPHHVVVLEADFPAAVLGGLSLGLSFDRAHRNLALHLVAIKGSYQNRGGFAVEDRWYQQREKQNL